MWISTDLHPPSHPPTRRVHVASHSILYTQYCARRQPKPQPPDTESCGYQLIFTLPLTPLLGHYHEPELVLFDPAEYMWPATIYCTHSTARGASPDHSHPTPSHVDIN
ncbi:hypothetical protein J6590_060978 [Homalodisca vitripennis]|nr:hypothetical protein J6590_060978 [Homalodisca vitripennis]